MTLPRRRGRPPTGTNPTRSMRLGPNFDEARRIAESKGETITAIIERFLASYVADERAVQAEREREGGAARDAGRR